MPPTGPWFQEELAGRDRSLPSRPLPDKNNKLPSAPRRGGHWGTVGPAGSLPEPRSPPGPGVQGGLEGGRGLGCRPAQLGNHLVDSGESGVGSPSKLGAMLLSPERLVSLPSWPGSQRGHRLGRPWRMGGAARDSMPWPSPSQAEQGGRGSHWGRKPLEARPAGDPASWAGLLSAPGGWHLQGPRGGAVRRRLTQPGFAAAGVWAGGGQGKAPRGCGKAPLGRPPTSRKGHPLAVWEGPRSPS